MSLLAHADYLPPGGSLLIPIGELSVCALVTRESIPVVMPDETMCPALVGAAVVLRAMATTEAGRTLVVIEAQRWDNKSRGVRWRSLRSKLRSIHQSAGCRCGARWK